MISLRLWTEVADHNITDFLRSTSLHGYKQQAKGENVLKNDRKHSSVHIFIKKIILQI